MSVKGQLGQLYKLSTSSIYKQFSRNKGVRSGRIICAALGETKRKYHTTWNCACSNSISGSADKNSNSRRRGAIGSETETSERKKHFSSSKESQILISRTSTNDDQDDASRSFRKLTESGPQLSDFIKETMNIQEGSEDSITQAVMKEKSMSMTGSVPYINPKMLHGNNRKGQYLLAAFPDYDW